MKTPETLEFPSLSHHDPDWIPLLHEARKLLYGRMERYVCKALPRRTVEEARMSGEISFYLKEAMGGDVTFITYMQSKGYPYVENEYATDLRVMWIEEILYFCELAKCPKLNLTG